jgi:hypothetical protein
MRKDSSSVASAVGGTPDTKQKPKMFYVERSKKRHTPSSKSRTIFESHA